MRAVIIGNGDIKDYQYIKSKINDNDFIICADGGYNHAEKMGIVPDVLIDDNNEIYLLKDKLSLNGKKGQTLSIIPIKNNAVGITTDGLEYPLNDETLYFGSSRGISNIMLADKCNITIKSGMALVIKVERV